MLRKEHKMDPEAARLGLYVSIALKGVFATLTLVGVLHAARAYKRLHGWQKASFWIAAPMTFVALLWVVSITYLVTHPWVAPSVPKAGYYFLVFASPTAAIAAGSVMGIFSNTPSKTQTQ